MTRRVWGAPWPSMPDLTRRHFRALTPTSYRMFVPIQGPSHTPAWQETRVDGFVYGESEYEVGTEMRGKGPFARCSLDGIPIVRKHNYISARSSRRLPNCRAHDMLTTASMPNVQIYITLLSIVILCSVVSFTCESFVRNAFRGADISV